MDRVTAKAVDDQLRSIQCGDPGVVEKIRTAARAYLTVVFVDTERPMVSIQLLTDKAKQVGIADDPEVRAAIEELQRIPKIGWD